MMKRLLSFSLVMIFALIVPTFKKMMLLRDQVLALQKSVTKLQEKVKILDAMDE